MLMFFSASASAISSAETTQAQASDQASNTEQAVWKLEHAYWDYVRDNNLSAYLNLWHKDFLGWPRFNAAPVGKDHITDWITSQTAKGLTFKSMEFKPARIQVTGDIAVACYWITYEWMDKTAKANPRHPASSTRGSGTGQINSGGSSAECPCPKPRRRQTS